MLRMVPIEIRVNIPNKCIHSIVISDAVLHIAILSVVKLSTVFSLMLALETKKIL